MRKKISGIKSISSVLLAEEAIKRGIKINHINKYQEGTAFMELSYKNHYEYIIGQKSSQITSTADYATINKALTKSLLKRARISVAEGRLFNRNKNIKNILRYIRKIGYPVVIKKNDGAHGDLVFVGMRNRRMCKEAISKVFEQNEEILVEKEFIGKEFRFIANINKVFSVTNREPANVIGDGIHSIKGLIDIKNSDPARGEKNEKPLTKIKIDDLTKQNLDEQNLDIKNIPVLGRKIYLRKESNISTGGDSIDVTDQVHPNLKRVAVAAVCAIPGLAYAGVDLMTNADISKKPTKKSYAIIELNSSPGIYPQYFPYKGKSRNVAKDIIDMLFPETKK